MQFFRWAIPESEMLEIRIKSGISLLETATSLFLFSKNFFHVIHSVKPSSAAAWTIIRYSK